MFAGRKAAANTFVPGIRGSRGSECNRNSAVALRIGAGETKAEEMSANVSARRPANSDVVALPLSQPFARNYLTFSAVIHAPFAPLPSEPQTNDD